MTRPMKGRKTVYKGITMRSRLEAGFAAWLDSKHFDWAYEPCAFASENGQYLPDFRLPGVFVAWREQPLSTVYVETKPEHFGPANTGRICDCPREAAHRRRSHTDACEEISRKALRDTMTFCDQSAIIAESEPESLLIMMMPGCFAWMASTFGDESDQWTQAIPVGFIARPGGRLGLAHHAHPDPWARGYWKAGRAS